MGYTVYKEGQTVTFAGDFEQYAVKGDRAVIATRTDRASNDTVLLLTIKRGMTLMTPKNLLLEETNINRVVSFDSVILAEDKRQQILEALEQISQHDLIFNKWGFSETIEKGRGVSLLFYGPPGTGKTLMAQAIADRLEMELVIISTAEVESSEPGQAERNIRAQFEGAKDGKKILLFDECDSLIYERSSVGSILAAQVNELLSSLEKFDGISIFTTNRLGTLDEAFNRRLALKLEFDLPDRDQRVEIWKRMFPKKAPVDKDVDWYRLAVVEISGGYIKNAVLRAVRIAAIEKVPKSKKKIRMEHLVKALRLETESMIDFQKARNAAPMRRGPAGAGASMGKSRGVMSKEIDRSSQAANELGGFDV